MKYFVVVAASLAAAVTACGSSGSSPSSKTNTATTEPATTDQALATGVESPAPNATMSLPPALQTVLDDHNVARAKHCAAPLRWSAALEQSAKAWATKLTTNGCGFEHSGGDYGENLAAGTSPLSPSQVTAMWYGEISDYNWSKPAFAMNTGHFTQVIWADTTDLGCAVASCNGNDVWVCQYLPYGNVEGEYPDQVKPVCQ